MFARVDLSSFELGCKRDGQGLLWQELFLRDFSSEKEYHPHIIGTSSLTFVAFSSGRVVDTEGLEQNLFRFLFFFWLLYFVLFYLCIFGHALWHAGSLFPQPGIKPVPRLPPPSPQPVGLSLSKLRKLVTDRKAWHAAVPGVAEKSDMTERLNWTPGPPGKFLKQNLSFLLAAWADWEIQSLTVASDTPTSP